MKGLIGGLSLLLASFNSFGDNGFCLEGLRGRYKLNFSSEYLVFINTDSSKGRITRMEFNSRNIKFANIYGNTNGVYRVLGETKTGSFCYEVEQWRNGITEEVESKLKGECPRGLNVSNTSISDEEILRILYENNRVIDYFKDYMKGIKLGESVTNFKVENLN